MSILTSCFFRATDLRLGLGFILLGSVAAQAAVTKESVFVPKFYLLTTQIDQSDNDFLPPYQFSASVEIAPPLESTPLGLGLDRYLKSPSSANSQQETVRAVNTRWQQANVGNHVSLPQFFRFEFKGEWAKISFQPRSVSIEGEQLDVLFQPHSVSVWWSKPF
jgi:hypothetical protein